MKSFLLKLHLSSYSEKNNLYVSNASIVATALSTDSGKMDAVEGIALAIRGVGIRAASQPPLV